MLARPDTTEGTPIVARSLSGRTWVDAASPAQVRVGEGIAQRHGLPETVARLLAVRGVEEADVAAYLDPTLRRLMPDPSVLRDMDTAAERIAAAIRAREAVAIFGDYDVDGAASSALIARYLRHYGLDPAVHIPDRITEGYGPNAEAISALRDGGASLLVTVDCGTSGHEALAHARAIGLDVVVLDHHQTGHALPDVTALVNPNRQDCASGQGHLCAAGVVFLTLVAVRRLLRTDPPRGEPPLLEWLDLVALATVCDVVPLVGLNRAFVVKGLMVMGQRRNPGLAALQDAGRVSGPLTPYHLGFVLGPRINAGGRIGRAELGSLLLSTDDPARALAHAGELDRLNTERQALEAEMLTAAMAQAERQVVADPDVPAIVLDDPGWHSGLVGLLASRVKDRFRRPAIAIALSGKTGTGSGRSIDGVDLGAAIRAAVEAGVLAKGGGHAMAAGLTVAADRVDDFRRFLADHLATSVGQARAREVLSVDAYLTARGANLDMVRTLERVGPFGAGNPSPVFLLSNHTVARAERVGGRHVKLRLAADGASVDAIAFRAAETPLGEHLLSAEGQRVHVAGTLRIDRWNGREKVSMHVVDAAIP